MARVSLVYFDINTGYYPSFNHGLAYIIGTLKDAGHDVSLSHLTDEKQLDEAKRSLGRENPRIVGLSFTTNQKKYVLGFLEGLSLSNTLVVAGGVHCTLLKEKVFEDFPGIDGICIGEGEIPLKELCRRIDAGEDHLTVPSFCFKTERGVVRNPVSPLEEIDRLPLPDYTLFNYEKIISESGRCFPMMLGRGCPFSCHYCCNHVIRSVYPNASKYVRFPSVRHSMNIIKGNLALYAGTRKIIFADDTFTLKKKWLIEFCKLYKEEIGLPFLCNARVETIDDEVVRCLKDAGCISIDFGVESGNEWLRKHVLNRKHTNKEIRDAFSITRKHGIKGFSFNIVGLPFETKEMARDTLNLNLELRANYGKCFYFYPYPGTKLHRLCLEYDLLLDDYESLSGYLESPSVKELFSSHDEMRKQFETLNLFFYARLLFSRMKMPLILEKSLMKLVFLFRRPILSVLNPNASGRAGKGLRKIVRRLALKYLR